MVVKIKPWYNYNYYVNKYYLHNYIQIHWNDKIILKQIDSFDQNNINISNKIRKTVLSLANNTNNTFNTILGIGGEFYVYFKFIKANEYIGMSNHQCIVDDANYNVPYSKNYLVDYNNIINMNFDIIYINEEMTINNMKQWIANNDFRSITQWILCLNKGMINIIDIFFQ